MCIFIICVMIPDFALCFLCCVIFFMPCAFKFFLWSAFCLPLSVCLVPSRPTPLCSSPSLPYLASSLFSLLTCSLFGNQCLCIQSVCFFHSLYGHCILFVLYLSASVYVHAAIHAPATICFFFPTVCAFGVLHFLI